MVSDTTPSTKPAIVSFKLLNLTFPVLRNFLDIMPLQVLHFLRQKTNTIASMSRFRGEVVKSLYVKTDIKNSKKYTAYSEIMNRRSRITPCFLFDVFMSPEIKPKTLLSHIDGKEYIELHLRGNYHWRDVIPFLHNGLKFVSLFDNMDLPAEDLMDFFKTLIRFDIYAYSFTYKEVDPTWVNRADNAWDSVEQGSKFNLRFSTLINLNRDGADIVNFVLHRHGCYCL